MRALPLSTEVRLLRWRTRLLLATYTVVAVAAGYIVEAVAIDGWATAATWWPLAVVGLAAAVSQSVAWGWGHRSSARRGAILHLGLPRPGRTDDHQRWTTSHAILQSWVDELWPSRQLIAPRFAGPYTVDDVEGSVEDAERSVADFVASAAESVNAARIIAPGASSLCVFPEGAWMPTVGYRLARCLGDSMRLMADVSDSSTEAPMLEYALPRRASEAGPAPAPATTTPDASALLAIHVGRGDAPKGSTNVEFLDISEGGSGAVAEEPAGYEAALVRIQAALAQHRAQGMAQVSVNYKGPASLGFALGTLAWREGLALVDVDVDGRQVSSTLDDVAPAAPSDGRLHRSWVRDLATASALLGLFSITVTSAAALALEWGLARSQTDPNWPLLAWLLAAALLLGALGGRFRRGLADPRFTLTLQATSGAGSLARRRISPVTPQADPARWSLPRLAEIATAFPAAEITIDGSGSREDMDWGALGREVSRGFRGANPPRLRFGPDQWVDLEPRTCASAEEVASGLADQRLQAAGRGTKREHDRRACPRCPPETARSS